MLIPFLLKHVFPRRNAYENTFYIIWLTYLLFYWVLVGIVVKSNVSNCFHLYICTYFVCVWSSWFRPFVYQIFVSVMSVYVCNVCIILLFEYSNQQNKSYKRVMKNQNNVLKYNRWLATAVFVLRPLAILCSTDIFS